MALHLSAYGGRDDGLFVGAISESLFFPAQPYVAELEWQFDRIVQAVGCDAGAYGKGDTAMSCLRHKDMAALQALNIAAAFPGRTAPPNPLFYWTPCVDGELIPDLPYVMFESGRFLKMPVMFGTDTDGMSSPRHTCHHFREINKLTHPYQQKAPSSPPTPPRQTTWPPSSATTTPT